MATENEPANPDQARRVARIRAEIAEEQFHVEALLSAGLGAPVHIHKQRICWLEAKWWAALRLLGDQC